jgi:hypothetical protein
MRNNPLLSKRTNPLLLKRTQSFFSKRTIRLFQGPPTPILPCVVVIVAGVSRCHASLLLHCVVVFVSVSRKHLSFASQLRHCDHVVVVAIAPRRLGQYCHLDRRFVVRTNASCRIVTASSPSIVPLYVWFAPRLRNYGIPPHSNTSR